jgi:hypothetical protein
MTRRTRSQKEMEATLAQLPPGTARHQTLSAARAFKAAWVDLGEKLTEVREKNLFRAWGYDNFESYCSRELHVRRDTANKLTRSFAFVREHEPVALESRHARELPALDVVDLLSRAQIPAPALNAIRREVFDEAAEPATRAQVLRQIRAADPDAFRPQQVEVSDQTVRKALLLAERLQSLLQVQAGISNKAIQGVAQAVSELRELSHQEAAQQAA